MTGLPIPKPNADTQPFWDAAREKRKSEILAKLKTLGQRESKDSSEQCAIVNDSVYSTLTLSLAVDARGRVRATVVQAPRLNRDQSECLRKVIEADVFTSVGEPFTVVSVTLRVD